MQLIVLLYEDRAYYKDVTDLFKSNLGEQSANNIQVTLNKYLNALKVFGIKVAKAKSKYKLEQGFYSMEFTPEDIRSIGLLANSCETFPDSQIAEDISKFVNRLQLRMNKNDITKLSEIISKYDFSFYYSDLKTQIELAREICKKCMIAEFSYLKNDKTCLCRGKAKELIYNSKNAYLRVYEMDKNRNIDIPLQNILSYHESPQRASEKEFETTVVYELKNRLAKTYKFKDNEYMRDFSNGVLTVVNNGEPIDKLFSRLMRYSYNCTITNPKSYARKMYDLISETLDNYS